MKTKLRKITKKALSMLLAFVIIFVNGSVGVKAETSTDEIYTGDYECDIQDGNVLKVYEDDVCIAEFTYENGYRTSKDGLSQSTFTYEDGYLISEIRDGVQILYSTEYNDGNGTTRYAGFIVDEIQYKYIWDEEGRIAEITDAIGNTIAKYTYDGLVVTGVLEFRDSEWCETADEDFVGNYNKIRGMGAYIDEETGWHYSNGLYDDVVNSRVVGLKTNDEFLTNVNPFKYSEMEGGIALLSSIDDDEAAEAWAAQLLNSSAYNSARDLNWYMNNTYTDVEILARTIYGENTSRRDDQSALAWIILNRYYAEFEPTLRDIVTAESQFTGINNTQARNAKSSTDLGWEYATYLACLLCTTTSESSWKAIVSKPKGISNQLYFRPASQLRNTNLFEDTSNGLVFKYSSTNIVSVYNACIAGKGTATSTSNLLNYCGSSTSGYNVYFYHH